jgi:hypothetical protein
MDACTRHLRAGKRSLQRHDPAEALRLFHGALSECRVDHARLAQLLYYLGIALMRLGRHEAAIKAWLSGHRLTKGGTYSRQMLQRHANCYGMASQGCDEIDDWRAFLSIQLKRYLASKRKRRFSSDPERDMVRDLLFDHWKSIQASGELEARTPEEKRQLFHSVKIVFPFTHVPSTDEPVISVDFRLGRRAASADRCPCGSGLTFMSCCGRLSGLEDLANGHF